MCIAPTEPLRNGAAEFALELDKICSMLGAFGVAYSKCVCSAFTTDQLLRFKLLGFLLASQTVFQSSEIRLLTCVTEVISTFEYRILLKVVEEPVTWNS